MAAKSIAPVLHVSDLARSLVYFTSVLGFTENFRFGSYAGISLDEVDLHLSADSVYQRAVGGGTAYIFCDEVDEYYAQLKENGAILKGEPEDAPYGMREFTASDPDGNHLSFGCDVEGIGEPGIHGS